MTTHLPVAQIRTNGGTQTRIGIDQKTADEYTDAMAEGAEFPPIVVFYDGSIYWLADGFHRHKAACQLQRDTIAADVRQGTRRDAVLYSVGANASHGLRRNDHDKRRAIELLLRDDEWQQWSDREIARQCNVSPSTVGKIRKGFVTVHLDSDNADNRFYTNKHGAITTMNTAAIGQRAPIHRIPVDDYSEPADNVPSVQLDSEPSAQAIAASEGVSLFEDDNETLTHYESQIAASYERVVPVPAAPLFVSIRDQQRQVLTSQKSQEWYTPVWCIDAVRQVLGTIELDPASSDEANQVVQATRYYTLNDDGFNLPWFGSIFVNPPYNGKAASWCQKAVEAHESGAAPEGILLVFAKLGYNWFEDLWNAYPTCFARRRIQFMRPTPASPDYVPPSTPTDDDGVDSSGAAKHASAFVYFGPNRDRFRDVFAAYGRVIFPDEVQQ